MFSCSTLRFSRMQIILFLPFSATVRDPALALVLLYSLTRTIKEFTASA